MKNALTDSRASSWILLISILLSLVGFYAGARTIVNLLAFEKYPQGGVLSFNLYGGPVFQREEDCLYQRLYYKEDSITPRSPTEEENNVDKQDRERCLNSVKTGRSEAKINDISQSILFISLGIGLFVARRIFFK